jgi:hypothetical protein
MTFAQVLRQVREELAKNPDFTPTPVTSVSHQPIQESGLPVKGGECSGCGFCDERGHCPKCCDLGVPF